MREAEVFEHLLMNIIAAGIQDALEDKSARIEIRE